MSPPRRGAGKGRGRGGRAAAAGERGSDQLKPKKRERGSGNSKRGGRGGGRDVAASSSSSAAAAASRPTRAVTTVLKKVVVRNIPPTASEQETRELLQTFGVGDDVVWRFVPGRTRSNNRPATPARVYLDMKKEPERARKLIAALHGQQFYPETKEEDAKPLDVEFAPFQKIPREKQRKDAKVGTIDRDPEFMAFLEELAKPKDKLPSAEAVVDMAEGETVEKPVAALVKYLNERKVHARDKSKGKSSGKSLDKNGLRRQKGKKDGSKQKATKDKSKSSKDRQKKNIGDTANAQDSVKTRKQRNGRPPLKKDSSKSESTKPEPGVLRIMTPKSASAAAPSDSTPVPATKVNGTTPAADTSSERGSEKRAPKGGKKNGGRGRINPKKGKDGGDGGEGEGTSKGDLKPHPRRKSGNGGKKEQGNRGERKKKVFAPKDATAQGTPSKS